MKLLISIEFKGAAMLDPTGHPDVSAAVEMLDTLTRTFANEAYISRGDSGTLFDINGNAAGKWKTTLR